MHNDSADALVGIDHDSMYQEIEHGGSIRRSVFTAVFVTSCTAASALNKATAHSLTSQRLPRRHHFETEASKHYIILNTSHF